MNFKRINKIFKPLFINLVLFPPVFFIAAACGSSNSEIKFSEQGKNGIENAKKLKSLTNSSNLIEVSPENRTKIYQNKDAKFYLFDLNSLSNSEKSGETIPEYKTNFNPNSEISYLNLINRYYNSKQLQSKKKELNQDPNSVYIPNVDQKSLDFWYIYVLPTLVGFSEIEIGGKKTLISEKTTKLPRKLTPYSSVELKLLKKNFINNDNKNYLQINVNQMLNSFAFRQKDPKCQNCPETNVFGFSDSVKYPNYKLVFDSLDSAKKTIKFKIHKQNDNLINERKVKNEINSNISTMNFVYRAKEYKRNSNPDDYFEKNVDPKDKTSEFPFVRFYTQSFVVPFEGSENDFDSNFKILIEKSE